MGIIREAYVTNRLPVMLLCLWDWVAVHFGDNALRSQRSRTMPACSGVPTRRILASDRLYSKLVPLFTPFNDIWLLLLLVPAVYELC